MRSVHWRARYFFRCTDYRGDPLCPILESFATAGFLRLTPNLWQENLCLFRAFDDRSNRDSFINFSLWFLYLFAGEFIADPNGELYGTIFFNLLSVFQESQQAIRRSIHSSQESSRCIKYLGALALD